ncbi:replication endonuclease [Sodalis sp. RH24]|uniref:replication endonuclease n=1 Tax=unclassified Sodalis (in: enterobacteria) TaxID=2636512 RepID=UPI0039B4A781
MTPASRGRAAPSPVPGADHKPTVGPYPWNAPRPAIAVDKRTLTREQHLQGQAVLFRIRRTPRFLQPFLEGRYQYLLKAQGLIAANKFLMLTVHQRLLPRIEAVMSRNGMSEDYSTHFISEADSYRHLPDMADKSLRRFAGRIAAQLRETYELLSDAIVAEHDGDNAALFDDQVQTQIFGQVAGMAHALNVTPMHWQAYRKGKLTMRKVYSSIGRLVNDEWWERQLKAQRTRWREALLIAIGQVNLNIAPYASKQAVREVHSRRLANLEYLKSREIENVQTGERFDLIDKVMASISNPEIRRMELMSTIAGIERYAAAQGDVGMFLTITTPSKYHPTRTKGKDDQKTAQFNRSWDKEAFTPKDGQRYLVGLWSKIRTAFKDNDIKVYGMRVVEPHHDGTPHWHMMLFTQRPHRQAVINIMRRYALKEDGQERGAAKNRFDCKHLNKGGAAGYIAKYIAKNIDGYALEGDIDHESGKPLQGIAAAVTAWASTWRIPQFHPIGIPTMGAYRECRLIRHISLADSFDEQVEAVRAAADAGDFAAYMEAQGGANVARDSQTVRVARKTSDDLNEYDEEVQKVVGIFAPHLGETHIHETRLTEWRIVARAVDVNLLTLKSGSAAPRSPVNNCGWGVRNEGVNRPANPPKQAVAVPEKPSLGVIDWQDDEVVRSLARFLKQDRPPIRRSQQNYDPRRIRENAPSARMTKDERQRLPLIKADFSRRGIAIPPWELEALARGATLRLNGVTHVLPKTNEWEFDEREVSD